MSVVQAPDTWCAGVPTRVRRAGSPALLAPSGQVGPLSGTEKRPIGSGAEQTEYLHLVRPITVCAT